MLNVKSEEKVILDIQNQRTPDMQAVIGQENNEYQLICTPYSPQRTPTKINTNTLLNKNRAFGIL